MKKIVIAGGACFLALILAMLFSRVFSQQMGVVERPASAIGARAVDLTGEHLICPDIVRGFIETGSGSENCFATLREATDAGNIQVVFCAHRFYNGKHGILITVRLFAPVEDPTNFAIGLVVFQEFAHGYAMPVIYYGD